MAVNWSVRSHLLTVTLLFTLSLCLISPWMSSHRVMSTAQEAITKRQVDSQGGDGSQKVPGNKESIKSAKKTLIIQRRLLYQVEKGIHELSIDDIQYIFNMGRKVFALALAEKLGYKYDENDPHVDVIDAHKDNLIERLNETLVRASYYDTGHYSDQTMLCVGTLR